MKVHPSYTGDFPASSPEVRLYCARWQGSEPVAGVVGIIHGFGEHIGRYGPLISALTAGGYTVFGYDQRGHGKSPGQRGHIDRWNQYRGDVKAFTTWICGQEQHPLYLYGHSMGALVLLEYLLFHPPEVRGAVISGAPLEPSGVGNPLLKALAVATSRLLPRLPLKLSIKAAALSRDEEVVEAYQTDPLVHDRTTPRWGTEALAALDRVRARPGEQKTSCLYIHGDSDRLNALSGVQDYYDAMPLQDKKLIVYPGSYHEVHLDLDREQVFQDMVAWLRTH